MLTQNLPHNKICKSYIDGDSVLSLSHQYNTNTRAIQKILDDNYIPKVTQAKRFNPSLNEDYFNTIDTKEKAYWIGLILADGCVYNNSLQISLQENDKYILELLQNDLGLQNHIKIFNKEYFRFDIGSKKICNDLKQYGIVPNKTMSLNFPQNIPKEFQTHLLRGMFDGDGGLTIGNATRFYKHRNKYYTKPYQELSYTGTYDMCQGFHDTLQKYVDFNSKSIKHNHSIYRVRWSNREEIIKILSVLYGNCNDHFLKRKYLLFQQIKELKEGELYD